MTPRPQSNQPLPEHAKLVFKGEMFDVYQWEQVMYDGTTKVFEKLKRPDTVIVIPVLNDGRIMLTCEEQPGKKPFIGTCGGRVDAGEDPLGAAKREFLEETGYEATDYTLWKAIQPVSKIDWAIYIFIAKGCTQVAGQTLDGGEKIEPFTVTFDEWLQMARDKSFPVKELIPDMYEALLDVGKYEELKALLLPLGM